MATQTVPASQVITRICRDLGYSRAHVAKTMRESKRQLGAKRKKGRWQIPAKSEQPLTKLVQETSGRRYKLGERGPHTNN